MKKTPEQKKLAVLVAKDVLKMLNPRSKLQYIPKHGTYISLDDYSACKKFRKGKDDVIAQDALKQGLVKHCQACAIGGLFIAHVMRMDGLTLKDFFNNKTLFVYGGEDNTWNPLITHEKTIENGRLGECFTASELKAIEDTFEGKLENVDAGVAMKFICNRIVENDGEFKRFSANELKKIVKEHAVEDPCQLTD
jgi:hypothetical protein